MSLIRAFIGFTAMAAVMVLLPAAPVGAQVGCPAKTCQIGPYAIELIDIQDIGDGQYVWDYKINAINRFQMAKLRALLLTYPDCCGTPIDIFSPENARITPPCEAALPVRRWPKVCSDYTLKLPFRCKDKKAKRFSITTNTSATAIGTFGILTWGGYFEVCPLAVPACPTRNVTTTGAITRAQCVEIPSVPAGFVSLRLQRSGECSVDPDSVFFEFNSGCKPCQANCTPEARFDPVIVDPGKAYCSGTTDFCARCIKVYDFKDEGYACVEYAATVPGVPEPEPVRFLQCIDAEGGNCNETVNCEEKIDAFGAEEDPQ